MYNLVMGEYKELVYFAKDFLWTVRDQSAPETFQKTQNEILYRRMLETMAEQCDAILALCEDSLFRPAHSVLRGLFETASILIWLATDVERYGNLFLQDKHPNLREILRRIEWELEYDTTYRFLSGIAHSNNDAQWMYRELDAGDDGISPEIISDGENFVAVNPTINETIGFRFSEISAREAANLYEPYLCLKTADIILCTIYILFEGNVFSKEWWPAKEVFDFEVQAGKSPDISKKLLWWTKGRNKL